MPWSYTDPSSSDKDAVRFEAQDTDVGAQLLSDGEIDYAILRETGNPANGSALTLSDHDVFSSAARCCEALARRFAAQADTAVGSLQVTYSKSAELYADRAKELRAKAQGLGVPYVGGQSWDEKEASREDPDRVQPRFRRGEFRNPFEGPMSTPPNRLLDG